MLKRLLLTVMVAGFALMLQPGCGGGAKAPVAAKPDTAFQTGAICDTTLTPDSTSTAIAGGAAQPDTQKPEPAKKVEPEPQNPKPEPEKVAEKPKELPKMWDFGSTNCIPCKTMKGILDPMIVDYKGKVDIRIVNVHEDKELTNKYGISVIPTQVFIDTTGKILFRHIGVYPRDSIEAKFREFGMPIVTGALSPAIGSECLT
jgi:thiol-disulfide isomerase/thioredoxin